MGREEIEHRRPFSEITNGHWIGESDTKKSSFSASSRPIIPFFLLPNGEDLAECALLTESAPEMQGNVPRMWQVRSEWDMKWPLMKRITHCQTESCSTYQKYTNAAMIFLIQMSRELIHIKSDIWWPLAVLLFRIKFLDIECSQSLAWRPGPL